MSSNATEEKKNNWPIQPNRLKQICNDACVSALQNADAYVHSMTEGWNNAIINHILRSLISESTPPAQSGTPASTPYKFAVNSTIIQHAHSKVRSAEAGGDSEDGATTGGRRGMHSACGGFWNTERDGMWSFKYETKSMKCPVLFFLLAMD